MINNLFSESEIESMKAHFQIQDDLELLQLLEQTSYAEAAGVYSTEGVPAPDLDQPRLDFDAEDV